MDRTQTRKLLRTHQVIPPGGKLEKIMSGFKNIHMAYGWTHMRTDRKMDRPERVIIMNEPIR